MYVPFLISLFIHFTFCDCPFACSFTGAAVTVGPQPCEVLTHTHTRITCTAPDGQVGRTLVGGAEVAFLWPVANAARELLFALDRVVFLR